MFNVLYFWYINHYYAFTLQLAGRLYDTVKQYHVILPQSHLLYMYNNINNNIYLLNRTYNNIGYKWTPQEVIDLYMLNITVRSPGQYIVFVYKTNSNIFFLVFYFSFIKFLINTREKQELSGVELCIV